MNYDSRIEIFGKVFDVAAIRHLADCAEREARLDWSATIHAEEFAVLLSEVAERGEPLLLTVYDARDPFSDVTAACQEAGLSYIVHSGASGSEGYTEGCSWTPGMREELHFAMNGEQPSLSLDEIRKIAAHGVGALMEFVSHLEASASAGKIDIEPGFVEAYAEALQAAPAI